MTILHSALAAELARLKQQELLKVPAEPLAAQPSIRWIQPKRRQRSDLAARRAR